MVFVEGTVLMHKGAIGVSREERVRQSHEAGMQKEEAFRKLGDNVDYVAPLGSVHDYSSYVPVGGAVKKLKVWKSQGATIYYLSSRRIKNELDTIRQVLERNGFPDNKNLVFRNQGENYKDVVGRNTPDILIEDDCESVGGKSEMTYPSLRPELKQKIKSVVVREFNGVDELSDKLEQIWP